MKYLSILIIALLLFIGCDNENQEELAKADYMMDSLKVQVDSLYIKAVWLDSAWRDANKELAQLNHDIDSLKHLRDSLKIL